MSIKQDVEVFNRGLLRVVPKPKVYVLTLQPHLSNHIGFFFNVLLADVLDLLRKNAFNFLLHFDQMSYKEAILDFSVKDLAMFFLSLEENCKIVA